MSKILSKLWNGQLCPIEECCDRDTEIRNLCKLMSENKERLSQGLTEQQKVTLQKYDDAVYEMLSLAEENCFIKGFRLAVKCMIEAMR